MKHPHWAFVLVVSFWLGLACSGSGLSSHGAGGAAGLGQGGSAGSGGMASAGGAGGDRSWTSEGKGGTNLGGKATGLGGTYGGSGGTVIAGRGGSSAGGSGGTARTTCVPIGVCQVCPYGTLPSTDPCNCPRCASADAGPGKDAAADACPALPCAYPLCPPGSVVSTPPCGCPTCVTADAGPTDATKCPLVVCPAIACANGSVPNPDPCGCPICAGADAAADTGVLACVGLDECTCHATQGCSPVADTCYCPFPKCSTSGACICGGGRFVACAPSSLSTCAAAKARVASLCPNLSGATFSALCQTDTACVTKCLNELAACGDASCSFCDGCDCATDKFMQCRGKCQTTTAP